MDKIKLEFKAPSATTIVYNNKVITVDPVLTLEKQVFLSERYVNEYINVNNDFSHSYLNAEINLRNYVFQLNTNIDTENIDPNILMDEALWESVCSKIDYFWKFRDTLDTIIRDRKEEITLQHSLGQILTDLAGKASEIMVNLSNITPEEIKSLQEKSMELIGQLQESSTPVVTPKKIARKKA